MSTPTPPHPRTPSPAPRPATAATAPVWANPQRQAHFWAWFARIAPAHQLQAHSLQVASADASFRRYFRVSGQGGSFIIMDAPPEHENCQRFVQVAQLMAAAGLRVPQVLDWEPAQGFMLLSDLGTQTLLQAINPSQPEANRHWYLQAVDALIAWQTASRPGVLPPYDSALLQRELSLFPDWYVAQHRRYNLTQAQLHTLQAQFARIVAHNLAWPGSVYVHRDFMPRNLIVAPHAPATAASARIGVLDFQDAVYGPISYDIASLLQDAFISWDEDFCLDITVRYWEQARRASLPVGDDFGAFYQAVQWMGLQRHLKVAGIFARLTLRDGKPHYLADAPRFIGYIRTTCARYRALTPLLRLLDEVEGTAPIQHLTLGRDGRL